MLWKQKPPQGTPLIPKHPHLDGLEAWWLFQEGGGDQVYDLSGNGNTGTLNNFAFPATTSSGWNPGKSGLALAYDGANDYVNVGTMGDFGNNLDSNYFTFSCWLQSSITTSVFYLTGTISDGGNTFVAVSVNNDVHAGGGANNLSGGRISLARRDEDGQIRFGAVKTNTGVTDGDWHHLLVMMSCDDFQVWLDGQIQQFTTHTAGNPDNMANFQYPLYIGAENVRGALTLPFNGLMDDVRIHNSALTSGEIFDLYINSFAAFQMGSLATIIPPVAAPVTTFYPDLAYPDPPLFPAGHDDVPIAGDFYTATTSQITALAAEATLLFDQIGNIELGATEGVGWNDGIRIDLSGGEIQILPLQVNTELVVDTPTLNTLNVTGDIVVGNDLTASFAPVTVGGVVTADYVDRLVYKLTSQIDEPGNPADNHAVFWMSSGVGFGDAADLCCKITEGGGTTDFIISDYSAL